LNILFVNYGDYTTNSLNHIGGFANALCASGHACVVAVPHGDDTLAHVRDPLFVAATFDELLARPNLFPDGRTANVVHAWTPREVVRKFVLGYQRAALPFTLKGGHPPARVIIHLEDNEEFLIETFSGRTQDELRKSDPATLEAQLNDGLAHPLRHRAFLQVADAATVIVESLAEFVPAGVPHHRLFPGVDFSLYHAQEPNPALRRELGLRDEEKVIVFTGSNTFANEPEMRELYLAVALLNREGPPTRLVRTGFNTPSFLAGIADDVRRHVLDLGFVAKDRLPRLLALADVLVQPGRAGPFNDYRLPSKLPEFLASGRPVVLPPANIAALMKDGREAIFLPTGTPSDIAETCRRLFATPDQGAKVGRKGAAFARRHFDLEANSRELAAFYTKTLARQPANDWAAIADPTASEITLFAKQLNQTWRQNGSDVPANDLAARLELLTALARQLEQGIEHAARPRIAAVAAERDAAISPGSTSRTSSPCWPPPGRMRTGSSRPANLPRTMPKTSPRTLPGTGSGANRPRSCCERPATRSRPMKTHFSARMPSGIKPPPFAPPTRLRPRPPPTGLPRSRPYSARGRKRSPGCRERSPGRPPPRCAPCAA